jgi:hypothetical protein
VGRIDLSICHVYIVAHLGVGFGCRSAERWARHELKPGEKDFVMYILKHVLFAFRSSSFRVPNYKAYGHPLLYTFVFWLALGLAGANTFHIHQIYQSMS